MEIKKPIVLSNGQRKQIEENQNIGQAIKSNIILNHNNNNEILIEYTDYFINTTMTPLTLYLPTNPPNGCHFRLFDYKKTFRANPLTIKHTDTPINHKNEDVMFSANGSIVDFLYVENSGWLFLVDPKSLALAAKEKAVFSIQAPLNEENRTGLAVYQSTIPNLVDLANANNPMKAPVLGFIVTDFGGTVEVETSIHSEIIVEIDGKRTHYDDLPQNPQPGKIVYLSDIEDGKVTTIDPEMGTIQRLGMITEVIDDRRIKIIFFPHPEFTVNMCHTESYFGQFTIIHAAAGTDYNLVIDRNGNLWSWGENSYGQCGTGDTQFVEEPFRITQICPATYASAGTTHSLAIDANKDIWVWGDNSSGQLGVPDIPYSYTPIKLIVS